MSNSGGNQQIDQVKSFVYLIWRKRIPPIGRVKLNLEESHNKSACQKFEILLFPQGNCFLVRKPCEKFVQNERDEINNENKMS